MSSWLRYEAYARGIYHSSLYIIRVRADEATMSGNLRKEALRVFKKLHRTRLNTFRGDEHALDVARRRINDEFRKNKNLSDEGSINELIKLAVEVEHEVRTTVVQAVQKEPGRFELRITDDTVRVSNEILPGSYKPRGKLKKCTDNTLTDET